MRNVIQKPSPNFNARDPAVPLRYVVLHYTGMKTGPEALARLCDPVAQVSAHYVIEEDGRVFQLVDEAQRAWHAGKSFWGGVTDVNSASIGIELVNPGHEFGYRAFPAAQIAVLKLLLKDILARQGLNPLTALLAHSDIAPERKEDPGELFPWAALAQDGLGSWPDPCEAELSDVECRSLLTRLGYADSPHAFRAFCRRYAPEALDGPITPAVRGRLRRLVEGEVF